MQVLTPVQVARAMVHSYPWMPDVMAIAAVVAAEVGDAEALMHLRADNCGGPGAFLQPRCGSAGEKLPGGVGFWQVRVLAVRAADDCETRRLHKGHTVREVTFRG
jgi:hypothetical protein